MNKFVIDASVAAKWFANEKYSDIAVRLCATDPEWIAPDLLYAEVGNVLRKKVHRKEMNEKDAGESIELLHALAIRVVGAKRLVLDAVRLAIQFQCTVYDSLYLTAAIREDCAMVTADRKFYNTFSKTDLQKHMLWIEYAV